MRIHGSRCPRRLEAFKSINSRVVPELASHAAIISSCKLIKLAPSLPMASAFFVAPPKAISYSSSVLRCPLLNRRRESVKLAGVATESTPSVINELVPPPVVPFEPAVSGRDAGKLAAWRSIRKERWQGELAVEGDIPLWLV